MNYIAREAFALYFSNSYPHIITDDNLMETASHGSIEYPFQFYYENMEQFDFNCVDWHWHTELEFVLVESDYVTMWIGDQELTLSEGDAIFINTKMLHKFHSSCAASIPNFLCMPSFIAPEGSLIYKKYVLPIINSNIQYLVFNKADPASTPIISDFQKIISIHKNEKDNELLVSSLMQHLWLNIHKSIDFDCLDEKQSSSAASLSRLQIMMQFIHEHYTKEITLEDIAAKASISKSTALNLINKYLHITPVNYLISYRLKVAAAKLSDTEKKINTISTECGFNSIDYFCRVFKKQYHISPGKYRKNKLGR